MIAYPIWKDKIMSVAGMDSVEYRILADGVICYNGKAYKRPGESSINIRINDICEDLMKDEHPYFVNASNVYKRTIFRFDYKGDQGEWNEGQEFTFVNDWSYDFQHSLTSESAPILMVLDAEQTFTYSHPGGTSLEAELTYADGTEESVVLGESIGVGNEYDTIDQLILRGYEGVVKVKVDGRTWKVVKGCHKYALHYLNAFGGWDTFLIEGNSVEEQTPSRKSVEVEYSNATPTARGKRDYLNEITKKITLKTGWLTDTQSAMMHHLLNSNNVYLENLNTAYVLPVVIESQSFQVKTFKTEGKMAQYDIVVTIAQNYIRK